jgi:cytochrome c-type biogenesis protein CcsB
MKTWKQWFPYALAALCVAWILSSFRLPAEKELQSHAFGRIPIVEKGRIQPFDSFARNALLLIREKQSANYEPWKGDLESPKIVPAVDWAMELMFKPEIGDTRPVFRIDHPDVKGLFAFAIEPSKEAKTDGKHFSWNDLKPHFANFRVEAERALGKKVELREGYEKEVVELWNAIRLYKSVKYAFGPAASGDLDKGFADYREKLLAGRTAFEAMQRNEPFNRTDYDWAVDQFNTPLIVPPHHPERGAKDEWESALMSLNHSLSDGGEPSKTLVEFTKIAAAYQKGDAAAVRDAAEKYLAGAGRETAPSPAPNPEGADNLQAGATLFAAYDVAEGDWQKSLSKAATEQHFNVIEPFYKGMYLCVLAFLACLFYWASPTRFDWLRRAAVWLMIVVFCLHFGGQLFRMIHESRPPVTNLYSSAIFIGLMAVVFGLLLEWIFPHGIGVLLAAVLDFCALLIAHHITLRDGDTMVMLQAVLDTNFWLATHVVAVTLGYSATFMAGFLGVLYVILGTFTKRLAKPAKLTPEDVASLALLAATGHLVLKFEDRAAGKSAEPVVRPPGASSPDQGKPLGKVLSTMIYAIVCFGVLFSFVGTVLGGIWADQSWGRFWGWDVKENGALMIVLWNAIILHARWGGLAKERGIACLAVMGNIVTAWSWFGVNNLGIGLHSYGFTTGIMVALLCFVGVQIAIAITGMITCEPECVPRGQKPPDLRKADAPIPPPLPA